MKSAKKQGIFHYLIVFALLFSISSCKKDPGNYTYNTINEIKVSGIADNYVVDIDKGIHIDPQVSFTEDKVGDTTNYTYAWVLDHFDNFTSLPRTLSKSRTLNLSRNELISVLSKNNPDSFLGAYFAYYRVTDKKTGVFKDTYFRVTLGSLTYEGWLLLCDPENGNARLDMISSSLNDSLFLNILGTVKSEFPMNAKPSFICSSIAILGPPTDGSTSIFLGTAKTAGILGTDTLDYNSQYNINKYSFADPITDFSDARMYGKGYIYGLYIYAKGNVYASNLDIIGFQQINYLDNGATPFKASPFIAASNDFSSFLSNDDVIFNVDTKTFVRYPQNYATCFSFPTTPNALFNFSTGQDLRYMQFSAYNGGEVFALLTKDGKTNLARFTSGGEQHYYSEVTGTDINSATLFAVNPEFGYVFYSVGGKLYEYDFLTKKSILMKDYGTRKISLLKFQSLDNALYSDALNYTYYRTLSKKLIVCTYDNANPVSSGTFELFTVPNFNAPLQLYKSYSGTGKVIDIAYKER